MVGYLGCIGMELRLLCGSQWLERTLGMNY